MQDEGIQVKPSALLSVLNKADQGINQAISHFEQRSPLETAAIDILEGVVFVTTFGIVYSTLVELMPKLFSCPWFDETGLPGEASGTCGSDDRPG